MQGHSRKFLVFALLLSSPAAAAEPDAALHAVPTYASIGLYWTDGIPGRDAQVTFRKVGTTPWRAAQPLVYDERRHEIRGRHVAPWRGSIVGLASATEYEVRVEQEGRGATRKVRTWNDKPTIGRTIEMPERSGVPLIIRSGGHREGYTLYRPLRKHAVVDVANAAAQNILIDAPYVVIRGLTLRGAREDAIKLGPRAHDIVIEENDISGWGRMDEDGFGVDRDAAIGSVAEGSGGIARITIQKNRIHSPRARTNSWAERREVHKTNHPLGAHGVFLWDTDGNHVIRHNDFFTRNGNIFNDVIGGGENFHVEGAPGRDSDIYGNSIADCMDDGIESEGGNINVRIWANRIDRCYVAIAATPTHIGPLYVFRNVALGMRYTPRHPYGTGVFLKLQSKKVGESFWGGGRVHVYHNSIQGIAGKPGAYAGITPFGTELKSVHARNNIFVVSRIAIDDPTGDPSNDYDRQESGQAHRGDDASASGLDRGVKISNFNDDYRGSAPDVGAQEQGGPRLRFGSRR